MRNPKAWVVVGKLARCKDCGDEQVAWVQSSRTKKWYLATADVDGGQFRANKLAPHFTTCTKSLKPVGGVICKR